MSQKLLVIFTAAALLLAAGASFPASAEARERAQKRQERSAANTQTLRNGQEHIAPPARRQQVAASVYQRQELARSRRQQIQENARVINALRQEIREKERVIKEAAANLRTGPRPSDEAIAAVREQKRLIREHRTALSNQRSAPARIGAPQADAVLARQEAKIEHLRQTLPKLENLLSLLR